jgi:hypothetical protein
MWDYKVLPHPGSEEINDHRLGASYSYDRYVSSISYYIKVVQGTADNQKQTPPNLTRYSSNSNPKSKLHNPKESRRGNVVGTRR